MRLNDFKLGAAAIGFALLAGACGGASATEPGADTTDVRNAAIVREVLGDAGEIAKTYSRQHLGHVLKLSTRALQRGGLEIPSGMKVIVETNHSTYCITTRSSSLSRSHAWAVATTGSNTGGPSPEDRCPKGRY